MIAMQHIPAKIMKKEKESSEVTSFTLDADLPNASPGQFVMLWLPGFDEKPYSVAGISPLTICAAAAGPFSKMLCGKKEGDIVMVRGPYGRGFEPKQGNALLVGGGYGFAPLRFLARALKKKGATATAICGARGKGHLMKEADCKTVYATEDGSRGLKGTALDAMKKAIGQEKFDVVYTCGPEKMMGAVARLAKKHGADCQLLLERHIKCGMGICGHCCVGDRLVCCDGPRFGYEILGNPDFEKSKRGKSGRVEPV